MDKYMKDSSNVFRLGLWGRKLTLYRATWFHHSLLDILNLF